MEVTFRKNLSRSYMCVEEQGQFVEEYELYMLEKHKIPGLLQMQTVFSEGKRRYLYDISGKQQIDDYFSGKKIGYEMLRRFLFSVQEMCSNLSEYFLREEGICLEMEFIYVNLEDGSLQFTYLPFYEKSLQEGFESCMEQFLRKIDHQDKAAVELGYQIYQLCSSGNANIGKLLETSLGKPVSLEKTEPKESRNDTWEKESPKRNIKEAEGKNKEKSKNILEAEKIKISKKSWKAWKSEWEENWSHMMETVKKYLSGFREISVFKRKQKELDISERVLQETPETTLPEDTAPPVHPTEILGVQKKKPVGKLVYQGVNSCEDILIKGENFLIGKNREQVDGIISAEGVSRLHARITREDNTFFIEDLNSTNGTYLNDKELEYHEPQELKPDDRIRFGVEEYMFL